MVYNFARFSYMFSRFCYCCFHIRVQLLKKRKNLKTNFVAHHISHKISAVCDVVLIFAAKIIYNVCSAHAQKRPQNIAVYRQDTA